MPWVLLLLGLGGLNACLLNIANFLVTAYTSAVTLQVPGQDIYMYIYREREREIERERESEIN